MNIIYQTRLINTLLAIGVIVLILFGILTYRQVQQLVRANASVVYTHKVIEAANVTLLSITDAESRLSLYAITNNKSTINELPRLINIAQRNLHLVKQLTQHNPMLKKRVEYLESLINQKIDKMKKISLDDTINSQTRFAFASSQERMELKKEISRVITEINNVEENLLKQRNVNVFREVKIINLMLIVVGVLTEFFIILSCILLNYNIYHRNISERKRISAENELKQSNKLLQASEERLLLAMEGSSAGLWDWEVGTNNVFYSDYFKKMLGYTEEEFPNTLQSFEKIIHPHDHDRVWTLINEHLKNHTPFKIEYRLRTKLGNYNWFEAGGEAQWDETGVPVRMSGSLVDIEERKKDQQRLSIQHAVAEILSEALTLDEVSLKIMNRICQDLGWEFGAIWMVDLETNTLLCTRTWHEPSPMLKLFTDVTLNAKFSYGEDIPGRVWKKGKPLWFADIGNEKEFSRASIAKKIGLNSSFSFPIITQKKVVGVIECFTMEQEKPDKRMLDLMLSVGSQIGQFISRKLAEAKLRESEAYKAAILESASDSIITINEQNNILSFNSQTIKEFKYLSNELQNRNIETLLPNFISIKKAILEKPSIEMIGIRKNEIRFPIEIKISKMNMDKQEISVLIIRDITERKKIEKLKNEFISVVSHELRTPLTSIHGALGLILGGAVGVFSDKIKNLLILAKNNCDRLLLLINDILDIEKIEAGKMNFEFKIIDLNKLINDAIVANTLFAEKYGVSIVFTPFESDIKLNVDPARLMQVLTNLISNAVKFSPKGEEVRINIKRHRNDARVLVSNMGQGIPTEFQPYIFNKFSQADTSNTRGKGGTGLGLNISRTLIEKLGGKLNFISKPDEITTFYFDLPVWQDPKKAVIQEMQDAMINQGKLLICEDDENQANYLKTLLESAGFKADIANTTAEARNLLAKDNYIALLLDLILPDQDGISFIRELRTEEKTRTLPIIVLSVMAQAGQELLDGESFPVLDWLDKPIDFEKLLQSINLIKMRIHPDIPNVLHIEDDDMTFEVIKALLSADANVISATSIKEAKEKLRNTKFDLVILDLLLPDGNAEEIMPLITEYKLPVVIYSAIKFDKELSNTVKHALIKSETTNERLLSLIKHILETT